MTLVLSLAACGADDEESAERDAGSTATEATTPTPSGGAVAKLEVRETEFEIDPMNPRIHRPGTVTFRVRNAGRAPHALEVEGPTGEVETDTIEPGASATLRADLSKPGSYKWYCPVGDHEARGMKGRITVAGGGAGGSEDHSGRRHEDSGKDEDDSGTGSGDSGNGKEDSGGRSGAGGGGSGVY